MPVRNHWREREVAKVLVYALELKKVPAQKRVTRFLGVTGTSDSRSLYDLFNKKTLDCMFDKGLLVSESFSRLREDDREMVYWSEVRLTTKLEKVLS